MKPFVSIIVPVYNDEDHVKSCLRSLLNQSYPQGKYEVIVADNGSVDNTRKVVQKFDVRLVIEKEIQGSYAARNKGVEAAKGEIYAFIDADEIASDKWLKAGVTKLMENRSSGVTNSIIVGRVEPRGENKQNIWGKYDRITAFNKSCKTWNLFVPKGVFDKIGNFEERLISGGDSEWGRRANDEGISVEYSNNALLYHPLRNSLLALAKKQVRVGIGSGQRLFLRDNTSNYLFRAKEIIKEAGRFPIWIKRVKQTAFASYSEGEINLKDFIKFTPLIIFFGILTSFGRIKAIVTWKYD